MNARMRVCVRARVCVALCYCLTEREREKFLFNDALNTFYLRLYTSELRPALAGTRNSSMGPPHEGSIRRPTAPRANALPLSYVPL